MIESLHIKTVRRYFLSLCILEILYLLFYWNTVRINFFQVFFMISRTEYFTVLTHTHRKNETVILQLLFSSLLCETFVQGIRLWR